MKRHLILSAALSLLSTVAACSDTLSLDGMGEAAVSMTRAGESAIPFSSSEGGSGTRSVSSDTVRSFFVTVVAVEFQSQDALAGDSGWTRMDLDQSVRVDLMSLPEEGTTARVIAEGHIAAGSYRAVRLVISNPSIVFKGDVSFGLGQTARGGVSYNVELPGGDMAIEATAMVRVESGSSNAGAESTAELEFDAASSLSSVALQSGGSVLVGLVIR